MFVSVDMLDARRLRRDVLCRFCLPAEHRHGYPVWVASPSSRSHECQGCFSYDYKGHGGALFGAGGVSERLSWLVWRTLLAGFRCFANVENVICSELTE